MPYKVTTPELSVLEQIGEITERDGTHIAWEHQSTLYTQDQEVPDNKISPLLVKAYDEGDEHVTSVLERVEDIKPAAKPRGRKAAETTGGDE